MRSPFLKNIMPAGGIINRSVRLDAVFPRGTGNSKKVSGAETKKPFAPA